MNKKSVIVSFIVLCISALMVFILCRKMRYKGLRSLLLYNKESGKVDFYEIIPGKSVGRYSIGANYDSIIEHLRTEKIPYKTTDNNYVKKIITADIVFWFKDKVLIQIMVYNDFKGKVKGKVGIGSYLSDVEKFIGRPEEDGQNIETIYIIKDLPGICFELQDNDIDEEWNENTAPIETISVFK